MSENLLPEGSDEGRTPRVLILTASRQDYETVLDYGDVEECLHQNHPYYKLTSQDLTLRITHLGLGPEKARQTLIKLSGLLDPDFLLGAGTAGALKEDLSRGDVYMATTITNQSRTDMLHPPTDALEGILGALREPAKNYNVRSGPLVSVDEPVIRPRFRRRLHEKTGALAVDMESLALARHLVSNREDPPSWAIVRIISDTFEDSSLNEVKERQPEASRKLSSLLLSFLKTQLPF